MQGIVKWFSQEKGYGFITSAQGVDHYFHVQAVQGAVLPQNGDQVRFDAQSGKKGPRAANIVIVAKAQNPSRPQDDRITCPQCRKKIVPRMITYRGEPEKSVCPYCATTIKQFSKCFIATAVYGDPCAPQVRKLRAFRDQKLLPNKTGAALVRAYYWLSPPVANWLSGKPKIAKAVRLVLNQIVRLLGV